MTEYIEKEKALKALSAGRGCGTICYRAIDRIPAAEVEPVVHGRWKTTETLLGRCCVCSVCGSCPTMEYRYCPYCGARMDLGGTENA